MSRSNIPPAIIAGLALGAVIAAVATVGGPAQGRLEKRDQARYAAMLDISRIATCKAQENSNTLPEALKFGDNCQGTYYPGPNDLGFEGTFIYLKTSPKQYEICTEFEDLETIVNSRRYNNKLDKKTGCLSQNFKPK